VKIAETLSKTSLTSSLEREKFAKDPKGNIMQFAANELRLVTEKKLQRERILKEEENARFEAEMKKFDEEKLPPHALSRKKRPKPPVKEKTDDLKVPDVEDIFAELYAQMNEKMDFPNVNET